MLHVYHAGIFARLLEGWVAEAEKLAVTQDRKPTDGRAAQVGFSFRRNPPDQLPPRWGKGLPMARRLYEEERGELSAVSAEGHCFVSQPHYGNALVTQIDMVRGAAANIIAATKRYVIGKNCFAASRAGSPTQHRINNDRFQYSDSAS